MKCKGRLVFGQTDRVQECIRDLLPKSKRVLIDLGEVDYMGSSVLRALVRIYISAKTSHYELHLLNLVTQVRQMFEVTRILSLFEPCGQHNIRMP